MKDHRPTTAQSAVLLRLEELNALRLIRPLPASRKALGLLRGLDAKKVGIALAGAAAVTAAVNTAGRYRFHRRIVARELKRQLAQVNEKLDALQAQNEALRAELNTLRGEAKK